ncbi:MAG: UDP-N-acetylglucosamine--N-acetylmuramyl-(pentapeptide) pyrophosphoryl-undecaprenol N-acetylglucosamine transferase [Alphaproteobacteria bacterium]|nr:UDP-N-acetylglucosamine--N-acetylmuramyl-(pentapeptide) pyrophosphoryl-undecaprenol N-acetylglucosamine transferase [Alphaproteobacteria bacterium]
MTTLPAAAAVGQGAVIWLATGGTGGHVFPALALAEHLQRQGFRPIILSDARGQRYLQDWPAVAQRRVIAATPRRAGLRAKLSAAVLLAIGLVQALWYGLRDQPVAAIGFGGYASVPPMLAAWLCRRRLVLHDGNARLGAANRFLLRFAAVLAAGLPGLPAGLPPRWRHKLVVTGTPVRVSLSQHFTPWQPPAPDQPWRLLVVGGSQGARVFSDAIPESIALLPIALRQRLRLIQQCRDEDLARVQARYAELGVVADLAPFFRDMGQRYANCDAVIGRSGASTMAELLLLRRPAIMIPLAASLDGDQAANAASLAAQNQAVILQEKQLDIVQALAGLIESFMTGNHPVVQHLATQLNQPPTRAEQLLTDLLLDHPKKDFAKDD